MKTIKDGGKFKIPCHLPDGIRWGQEQSPYPVDLEVWSKLAQRTRIKRIASKFARDFDCDWQRVSAFSHSVTLTCVLLSQIISYSDTKGLVLVVMECKRECKCDLCIGVFTSYFKVNRV